MIKNTDDFLKLNCYECFPSCQSCIQKGNEINNNCIECNDNITYKIKNENGYLNCDENCNYYFYINITSNEKFCTKNYTCPEDYQKLIKSQNQCIEDCANTQIYKYENKDFCYSYDELLNNSDYEPIKDYILKYFNRTDILEGNDLEVEVNQNILIILSTTENQKNNLNTNKTSVNLGKKCESELKSKNNLLETEDLFMLKYEVREKGMKIPKIEYGIYYFSLETNKLELLNLTNCENDKADIYINVDINDNINLHKTNSDYYSNYCLILGSDSKIDFTLKERQKEFVNKNMTLCEEDCDLIEYNYTSKKAK